MPGGRPHPHPVPPFSPAGPRHCSNVSCCCCRTARPGQVGRGRGRGWETSARRPSSLTYQEQNPTQKHPHPHAHVTQTPQPAPGDSHGTNTSGAREGRACVYAALASFDLLPRRIHLGALGLPRDPVYYRRVAQRGPAQGRARPTAPPPSPFHPTCPRSHPSAPLNHVQGGRNRRTRRKKKPLDICMSMRHAPPNKKRGGGAAWR